MRAFSIFMTHSHGTHHVNILSNVLKKLKPIITKAIIHLPSTLLGRPVHLNTYTVIQSFDLMAAAQCVHSFSYRSGLQLMFASNIIMEKSDVCDFNHGMIANTRLAGLIILDTA